MATLRVTLQSSTSEVPKLQLQNLLISVEFRRLLYRQIHILVVAHHEKHQVVKQFRKKQHLASSTCQAIQVGIGVS